jgi:hypothetical protein
MTLLPQPLLLLLAMRFRGAVRRFIRFAKTPRGAVVVLVVSLGLGCWLFGLVVSVFTSGGGGAAARMRSPIVAELAPLAATFFFMLSLLRSPGEQAFVFLRAEIDILFPSPVSRRHLLVYKLCEKTPGFLLIAFFVSMGLRVQAASFLSVWIGMVLAFFAGHLGVLVVALLAQRLAHPKFDLLRRVLVAVFVAVVLAGAWFAAGSAAGAELPSPSALREFLDRLRAFAASPLGVVLTLPAIPFAEVVFAPAIDAAFFGWLAAALGIVVGLFVLVLRIDAPWMETSITSSMRVSEIVEAFRSGRGFAQASKGMVRFALPMPPWLGGFGPLAWRHATTAVRSSTRLIFVMIGIAVALGFFALSRDAPAGGRGTPAAIAPIAAMGLFYTSLFLPSVLRLDFRGDLGRMDLLRSLPVSATAVAASQIVVSAAVVTFLQAVVLLAGLVWWPLPALVVLAAIVVLFGLNLMYAAIDNCAILFWPIQPSRGAGVHLSSAQVIAGMARMLMLVGGCLFAGLVGWGAGFAASIAGLGGEVGIFDGDGPSLLVVVVALVGAAVGLFAVAVGIGSTVAGQFARWDPSREAIPDT